MYQAVWESLSRGCAFDIHYATVGGTGGIADTCSLYTALRIPVAVVADLDIITDGNRLQRVLQSLNCSDAEELKREAGRIVRLVKALPPTISEKEVHAQLQDALQTDLDWDQDHDAALRRQLQQLARQLDRMRRLKATSSEPLPAAIQSSLSRLLDALKCHGLFIVPVGELEGWLHNQDIKASKHHKWAWANEAAALVRKLGPQSDDVWRFIVR